MNIQFNGHFYKPTLDSNYLSNKRNDNKEFDQSKIKNTREEQKENKKLEELKKRDQEVRRHEQAHIAAAQDLLIRGANYKYEKGSDGKMYAVSGDVAIDVSEGKTPKETLKKAKKIIKSALAPQDPSSKDKEVAAQARKMEQKAKREIMEEKLEERSLNHETNETSPIKQYNSSNINNKSTIDYFA